MHNKLIIMGLVAIILFILMNNKKTIAQPDTLWTKTYGCKNDSRGNDVQQTSDDGYIIVGCIPSPGANNILMDDIWLIKVNADGDTLWTRTLGDKYDDIGYAVQQTSDNGYIIIGETHPDTYGDPAIWLIKTNSDGDTLWTKRYNGKGVASGYSVQQTEDGGYILTGWTGISDSDRNLLLIKTDSNGDSLWTKIYSSSGPDEGKFIRQTTDKGSIIAGRIRNYGTWLLKTDVTGDTLWTKTFYWSSIAYPGSVQQTADEGYIIVGTLNSWPSRLIPYLVKTNSDGDTQWSKIYSIARFDMGNSVQQTDDGGFIFVGYRIFRTDVNGDTLWTRDYGGIDGGELNSIKKTSDGGYIITGEKYRSDKKNLYRDVWLVRVAPDAGTTSVTSCETVIPGYFELDQNYPNPFNPSTTIEFALPKASFVTLKIYDLLGKEVATLVSEKQSAGIHQFNWDASGLASGVYLYRLEAGDFVQSKKLILMR